MKSPSIIYRKRILVVPLNWGLGHATRLIPVIRFLKEHGATILLGGSPSHLQIITREITQCEIVDLPYLRIRLAGRTSQILSGILQSPRFFLTIYREHRQLKRIIRSKVIDLVISDNCYGLWNRHVPSVIICHQVHIKLPGKIKLPEKLINTINLRLLSKFDECWIPDLPGKINLAGELSHPEGLKLKHRYTGILSRFSSLSSENPPGESTGKKKILIILSGPENQRTLFEDLIRRQLEQLPGEYVYTVVRGLPASSEPEDHIWFNHLDPAQLKDHIRHADLIICRAGYSTIMDLVSLGRSAVLVPTPGQSEQEYLASSLAEKGFFINLKQDEFTFQKALTLSQKSGWTQDTLRLEVSKVRFQEQISSYFSKVK